jgi:predicted deacetylase
MSDSSALGDLPKQRFLCVVLHDVAASTRAACARTLAAVAEVADVPVTLLAVPRYHGDPATPDLVEWLGARSKKGDEIALHGWSHRDELPPSGALDHMRRRHYTRSEGEFWALPEAESRQRIEFGVAWFREQGWPLSGFVAPAWLLGPGAWAALSAQPFEYTATLRRLVHLPSRRSVASQSVVYSTSSAWRRQGSLLWNPLVALLERRNPVLRIELHPRDADFSAVRSSWQAILERALRDRHATTVAEFMHQNRVEAASTIASTGAPTTRWPSTQAE